MKVVHLFQMISLFKFLRTFHTEYDGGVLVCPPVCSRWGRLLSYNLSGLMTKTAWRWYKNRVQKNGIYEIAINKPT